MIDGDRSRVDRRLFRMGIRLLAHRVRSFIYCSYSLRRWCSPSVFRRCSSIICFSRRRIEQLSNHSERRSSAVDRRKRDSIWVRRRTFKKSSAKTFGKLWYRVIQRKDILSQPSEETFDRLLDEGMAFIIKSIVSSWVVYNNNNSRQPIQRKWSREILNRVNCCFLETMFWCLLIRQWIPWRLIAIISWLILRLADKNSFSWFDCE